MLLYYGLTADVDPREVAAAFNGTANASAFSLEGAEALMAPYGWITTFAAVVAMTSTLGVCGALRTQKYKGRHRELLLLYYSVVLIAAAGCIWLAVLCLVFASRADNYVERYWLYIRAAFPDDVDESEEIIATRWRVPGSRAIDFDEELHTNASRAVLFGATVYARVGKKSLSAASVPA